MGPEEGWTDKDGIAEGCEDGIAEGCKEGSDEGRLEGFADSEGPSEG